MNTLTDETALIDFQAITGLILSYFAPSICVALPIPPRMTPFATTASKSDHRQH